MIYSQGDFKSPYEENNLKAARMKNLSSFFYSYLINIYFKELLFNKK